MWRAREKLSSALPRPTVARIENPEVLAGEKRSQTLLARNRGHAIAQDNHLLFSRSTRWRKEFGDNITVNSRSEHVAISGRSSIQETSGKPRRDGSPSAFPLVKALRMTCSIEEKRTGDHSQSRWNLALRGGA